MARLWGLLLVSCACTSPRCGSGAVADAGAAAVAPEAAAAARGLDDQPVYPYTRDPPEPAAQRWCDLVWERAEAKRKACCPDTPFTPFRPTGECVRTLSAALRAHAVELTGLAQCERAVEAEAQHCDWGGELPPPCDGVVQGRLPEGAPCRSALECEGGWRCAGLGTARPGRCAPKVAPGERCADAPDTLAAFVRQEVELSHPACDGWCRLQRCEATVKPGGACVSMLQCGRGGVCLEGRCLQASLPGDGQSCAKAPCASGLRCVAAACVAPRRLGEACESDEHCRSGVCDATQRCASSCDVIRKPAR